jgi:hypothetical protein
MLCSAAAAAAAAAAAVAWGGGLWPGGVGERPRLSATTRKIPWSKFVHFSAVHEKSKKEPREDVKIYDSPLVLIYNPGDVVFL